MMIQVPEVGLALKEYKGATCWQMYEWATDRKTRDGEPVPDGWRAMEKYPRTLEHGMVMLLEQAARQSKFRGTLTEALEEVREMTAAVVAAVERGSVDDELE